MDAFVDWVTERLADGNMQQDINLFEAIARLLTAFPFISIALIFWVITKMINRRPSRYPGDSNEQPRPEAPEAHPAGRYASLDRNRKEEPDNDASTKPVPVGAMFGGEYGKTKFGFDDSEWGSAFRTTPEKKLDNEPRIHVG